MTPILPAYLCKLILRLASAIVLFSCLFVGHSAADEKIVSLEQKNFSVELAPHTRFLIDNSKIMTPRQALEADQNADFTPVDTVVIDFGFGPAQFWLISPVQNAASTPAIWKLSPDVAILDALDIYIVRYRGGQRGEPEKIYSIMGTDVFSARTESHRSYVTEFALAPLERADILVQYSSDKATQLPLYVESPDAFYSRVRAEDLHNGTVLGLLVGLIVITTIYMAALGLRAAYFYGAYLFLFGLFLHHNDGYTFQFLWPNSPVWSANINGSFGFAGTAFLILFARAFVTAVRESQILSKALLYLSITYLIAAVGSFWLQSLTWFKISGILLGAMGGFVPLIAAVLAIRNKQPGGIRFLLGAAAVNFSIVVIAFGYLTPGKFNQDITGHVMRYSFLFEGIMFASAVFAHTQTVRKERSVALKRQVELGKEKLALSEALRSTETSYEAAANLAESRREVLAAAAHDIRQPLTSLRIALLNLNSGDATKAGEIGKSFDYLDEIVNANLDVARPAAPNATAKSAPINADVEAFNISVILNNVQAMFKEEAEDKGLEFEVGVCELNIVSRPIDLMRIVSNLVSNAIKNTKEGGVFVSWRQEGDNILLEIKDTGVGFNAERFCALEQPYARDGDYEGEGLGLALVKKLATRNNIKISCDSKLNVGTVFSLYLPQKR